MRRPLTVSLTLAAVGVMASGCVIVSGNKVAASPGTLMAACGSSAIAGVHREQLIEATSGFERVERINTLCADNSGGSRTLLHIEGQREGGGHGERTFVVRGERLEPVS